MRGEDLSGIDVHRRGPPYGAGTDARVLAVGASPNFPRDIAAALRLPVDSVNWTPSAEGAKDVLGPGTFHVVVIATGVSDADAVALAEFVGQSSPTTAVVVVRESEMDGALPTFMRAGVRDVVYEWGGAGELEQALQRAVAWSMSLSPAQTAAHAAVTPTGATTVSIFSSKGGSGKSFLACNLAAAIAVRSGKDTALVDLDLAMGDVFSYYGEEPDRSLHDLLARAGQLDAPTIMKAGTRLHDHLWGFGAPPDPAADVVPVDAVARLLRDFKNIFSYLVVDVPASYSDQVLTAFDNSDTIYLVASLDVVGVKHLSKALETLLSIGVTRDRLEIVLNRADSRVGLQPDDVERVLKIDIDAMIPSSRLVPTSLNKGRPVYLDEPDSEVARSIESLADKLIGRTGDAPAGSPPKKPKRRFFSGA